MAHHFVSETSDTVMSQLAGQNIGHLNINNTSNGSVAEIRGVPPPNKKFRTDGSVEENFNKVGENNNETYQDFHSVSDGTILGEIKKLFDSNMGNLQ